MRALALVVILGCGSSSPTPVSPTSAAAVAAPCVEHAAPSAPAAAMLDEAAVKAKSHAFLDALDRTDLAAATAELAPSFLRFDVARFYDAKWLAKSLEARDGQTHTRTYQDERVQLAPNLAVFMGESIEHVPASGANPAADVDRWNELVWAFDGTSWKLAHWTARAGGIEAERQLWNTTLRLQVGFKVTVNDFLSRWAKGKKPGTALDVDGGQGRNAVWLATQGWNVTEIDLSDAGLEIAKKAALAKHVKLTTVEADDDTYDFGTAKWDLVTLIYAGSQHALIERIKPSIKKGGWFVVEFFGKETTAGTGIGGFSPGELAALFPGWKIETDEVVDGMPDWGAGRGKVARFAAQKL
jgi:SAM-dependent methyltransferase